MAGNWQEWQGRPEEWEPRKLSSYQAAKIREWYAEGASQNWLANKYGVSKGTVKNIVQNKTYKEGI